MVDNRLWEWPFNGNPQNRKSWQFTSRLVQAFVFSLAKLSTSQPFTKKVTYNADHFNDLIENRMKEKRKLGYNSKPLITVVNHQSTVDDPLVWGVLLKWKHLLSGQFRWIPVAAEFCFTSRFHSFMFSGGRSVPVLRGLGVYQQGVDFCIDRLNEGQWVSLFPEGKINFDQTRRLKWGVGRMIAECDVIPDVIPIWVMGIDHVLPNKRPYIPRLRQTVGVYVGEPIQIDSIVKEVKEQTSDPMEIRKRITDCIEDEFWKTKAKATSLHENYMSNKHKS